MTFYLPYTVYEYLCYLTPSIKLNVIFLNLKFKKRKRQQCVASFLYFFLWGFMIFIWMGIPTAINIHKRLSSKVLSTIESVSHKLINHNNEGCKNIIISSVARIFFKYNDKVFTILYT